MQQQRKIIRLTEAAERHIRKIIAQRAGIGFRISIKQTGCSGYMYIPEVVDKEKEQDIKINLAEDLIVYIDQECENLIQGTVLDFVRKNLGMEQLVFNNPNVESLCGCGESFKLKKYD